MPAQKRTESYTMLYLYETVIGYMIKLVNPLCLAMKNAADRLLNDHEQVRGNPSSGILIYVILASLKSFLPPRFSEKIL